jgi:hypothetical protein
LTSLHVGKNNIPEKEMRKIMAIAMRMESMKILCEIPFKDKTVTKLDVSGKNLGMEGALVVAEYLDGNGTLLFLDISDNQLASESGWIDVDNHGFKEGDMVDYNRVQCPVSEAIDSSYKVRDARGILALADAIKDNGAIFRITKEDLAEFYTAHNPEKVPHVHEIIARYSAQGLLDSCNTKYGVQPRTTPKDKGALIKLDISSNYIGAVQEGGLQHICTTGGIELAT